MTSGGTNTYTRCIIHDKKGEEFSDARPNCMDAAATAKRPATCTEFKVWPAPSLGTAWKVVFFFYHACTSLPDRVCLYVCVCLCMLLLLFFKCTTDRKPKHDPVVLGSERETKTQLSSYQTERYGSENASEPTTAPQINFTPMLSYLHEWTRQKCAAKKPSIDKL